MKKGEKSTSVVFWKFFDREEEATTGSEEKKSRHIPMARDYWVFNAEQVDGYTAPEQPKASRAERIAEADAFFQAAGIDVKPRGNRAYYQPSTDSVHMPTFEAFKEPLFYYSVFSHESTHYTGAPHRLNRNLAGRFAQSRVEADATPVRA